MDEGDRDSGLRLTELLAAFSLAMDLGLGQPMEHVLRSWAIAARLGDHFGVEPEERGALYYVATLAWIGCVADTPEVAAWFGDDIAFRSDSYQVELTGLPMLRFMVRHVGAGSPPLQRLRLAGNLMVTGGKGIKRGLLSHCLTTAAMAERLGLGPDVCGPLRQMFTRWDGKGVPDDVGGDAIAFPMRLFHLADTVEVFHRAEGIDAAIAVARARRGTQFDPAVVDAFCAHAPDVLGDTTSSESDWNLLVANEPALRRRLTNRQLDAALEAMADFTDLRSPSRAGHSRGVADLVARAASDAGLSQADIVDLRRAGLLHDIGLHSIPATILDKAGALSASQSERMRMHTYYTQRMLARPAMLARIGTIASMAQERCDGSGYHRGVAGPAIPVSGRLLAAACAYRAMTEPRPYRPAMTPKQATTELHAAVRAGRLDGDAVGAVLAAAGRSHGKRRGPAGLTPREIEVLRLISRGASTREVARSLTITAKTAETHIERIYAKIGASTRSTATLFAMKHGLLETLEPLDL